MSITEHDRANVARLGRQSTGLPERRALREVNARQDVRKFAAEQKLSEDEALQAGMEQKAREFKESGAEVYARS